MEYLPLSTLRYELVASWSTWDYEGFPSQFEQDEADSKIMAHLSKGEVKKDFKTRCEP
jgi:hypothetical protein